jgi:hypothetical protein
MDMRMKGLSFLWMFVTVFTFGLPTDVSGPRRAIAESEPETPAIQVRRMAMAPFIKGRYGTSLKDTMDAPISGISYDPENVSEEADRILTALVHQELERRYGNRVIPLLEGVIIFDRIPRGEDRETLRTLARKTGEILEANVIMAGHVWRYKRRVGSALGVSDPASVGFGICLIDVATGKMLWQRSFEKTQQSLSENILDAKAFFKTGAKWLTADDLARFGIKEIFKKYPY